MLKMSKKQSFKTWVSIAFLETKEDLILMFASIQGTQLIIKINNRVKMRSKEPQALL
jgi:hypothetical protein